MPRVSLLWPFVLVTAAAFLIVLVRAADQGAVLVTATLALFGWLVGLFLLFGILFLFTYMFGLLEHLLAPPVEQPKSPFGVDQLPEQIVVPTNTEAR